MQFISFKVCKLSAKPEFIEAAKAGNVLARKCTKCDELHLATVYFCSKCGSKEFEDSILKGTGKVVTYTIMTVPPAGFDGCLEEWFRLLRWRRLHPCLL